MTKSKLKRRIQSFIPIWGIFSICKLHNQYGDTGIEKDYLRYLLALLHTCSIICSIIGLGYLIKYLIF